MMKAPLWLLVIAATLLTLGCASHKDPATRVVADIETSLNALREEGGRLAPAQLERADAQLAALKNSLAQRQYKAVVDAAPAVSSAVAELEQMIVAQRAQQQSSAAAATEQWAALNVQIPQLLAAVEARIETLSVPGESSGVSSTELEGAQGNLDAMQRAWAEAITLFGAGNTADAVTKAQAVKEMSRQVGQQLGMQAPEPDGQ